ncbi:MAG: NUDIX domain-containing protein [Nanoarchaeota archaeon]|nr:NUDIX domain-containing protein [Nanoarchaeota archaeon]
MDELIDIVDENDNIIGQAMKSEAHAKGLWHRAVSIYVCNSKSQILLQLRAKSMDLFPNVWEISASGHITADEEPITGAKRELKEEIGINAEDLIFIDKIKISQGQGPIKNNELAFIYLFKCDWEEDKFKIQKEEVQCVKWFDIDFFIKDLQINPDKYVPQNIEPLNKIKGLN